MITHSPSASLRVGRLPLPFMLRLLFNSARRCIARLLPWPGVSAPGSAYSLADRMYHRLANSMSCLTPMPISV